MSEDDSRTFIGRDDSQDESKEHRLPCVAAEEDGSDSSEMAVVNDDNNSTSHRDNQEDEEEKTQQLPLQDGYHHPSTLDEMRTDEGKEDAAATFSKEETLPSSLSMEESSPSPTRPQRTTSAIQYIDNLFHDQQVYDVTQSQNELLSKQEVEVDQLPQPQQRRRQKNGHKPPEPDEIAPLKRSISRRQRSKTSGNGDGDIIYSSSDDEIDDEARINRRRQKRSIRVSNRSDSIRSQRGTGAGTLSNDDLARRMPSASSMNDNKYQLDEEAGVLRKGTIAVLDGSPSGRFRGIDRPTNRIAPGVQHVVDNLRQGNREDDDTNAAIAADAGSARGSNGSFQGRGSNNEVDNALLVSAHLVSSTPESSTDLVVEATPADETVPSMTKGRLFMMIVVSILIVVITVAVTIRVIGGNAPTSPNASQDNETTIPNNEASDLPVSMAVFNPIGSTISGDRIGGRFGNSMAMSSDGRTVVVGEARRGQTFGQGVRVRVYRLRDHRPSRDEANHRIVGLSTLDWYQLGPDILGGANIDSFGLSVSISANGTIVACSTPDYSDVTHGQRAGLVQVYQYRGDNSNSSTNSGNGRSENWVQMGQGIIGLDEWDQFGVTMALSDDGTTLVASASQSAKSGGTGYVRVFKYENGNDTWNPMVVRSSNSDSTATDDTILGNIDGDLSGGSLSLSGNGLVLAVGTPNYSNSKGKVHVFHFRESAGEWVSFHKSSSSGNAENRTNSLLEGASPDDTFGTSVSLSAHGKCLAVGARGGVYVRVICYSQKDFDTIGHWEVVGDDVVVEKASDIASDRDGAFGTSVALSSDANVGSSDGDDGPDEMTLVVGSPLAKGVGGQVHVYHYNGRSWSALGEILKGYKEGDQFGTIVSISQNGKVLSASAPFADDTGHVRIYQSQAFSSSTASAKSIRLQLIHSSDNESYLQDPNSLEKRILHYSALYSGLQRMALMTEEGEDATRSMPVHLIAGDAMLPGVFYEASSQVDEFVVGEGVTSGAHNGIGEVLMFNALGNVGLGISSTDLGKSRVNVFGQMLQRTLRFSCSFAFLLRSSHF